MLNTIWCVYVTLIGACLGSFVNVVVSRLPTGVSLVFPRSRCPKCGFQLRWYHNLPLVSYLALRGRCSNCGATIAVRYLLVELLGALLGLALFLRLGVSWELLRWGLLSTGLLAIVFLDIDHWWVPDVITYPGMVFALATAPLPGGVSLPQALLGLVPAGLIWVMAWLFHRVTGREGLGLGDVKLLAVLGLGLGPMGGFTALFLGALQGAVVGVLVMFLGGHSAVAAPSADSEDEGDEAWTPPPRAIPFGPFLILGAWEVLLLPETLGRLPFVASGWLARLLLGH